LREWDGFLIVQSPLNAIYLAYAQGEKVPDAELQTYSKLLLNRDYDEEARRFLLTQFVCFVDVECWINSLRGCRVSFGTRIHGNLLALQAGVPNFIVPHDARTRELAETIGMPIVEQNDVAQAHSLPVLLQQIAFNGLAYDRKRIALASEYVSLLQDSGLDVASELMQLAHSSSARSKAE
jgi:polysaccharide pyruvyl transferase WcaK-like protein